MIKFFASLFNNNKPDRPTHEEIRRKTTDVITGSDETSQTVHNVKTEGAHAQDEIREQARKVKAEADKLVQMMDASTAIALTTPNARIKIKKTP